MKKVILLLIVFITTFNSFSQLIDTVIIGNTTPPDVHIYGHYFLSNSEISRIDTIMNDTVQINMIIKKGTLKALLIMDYH